VRLLLIRHAETDANRQGAIQGQKDHRLNALGQRQATALAERLRGERLQAIHSSDLRRCLETAWPIADGRDVEVRTTPRLRERDFGAWEGLTDAQVRVATPEAYESWRDDWEHFAPPGGESTERLRERAGQFLGEQLADARDGSVAVVTHMGPGKLIVCLLMGIRGHGRSFGLGNGSLSILEVPAGAARGNATLVMLNDTCHLEGLV
jgi:broad specificity phosphatase PhoE